MKYYPVISADYIFQTMNFYIRYIRIPHEKFWLFSLVHIGLHIPPGYIRALLHIHHYISGSPHEPTNQSSHRFFDQPVRQPSTFVKRSASASLAKLTGQPRAVARAALDALNEDEPGKMGGRQISGFTRHFSLVPKMEESSPEYKVYGYGLCKGKPIPKMAL